MKLIVDDLNETYQLCLTNGKYREKSRVDLELIKSMVDVAERGLSFIQEHSKKIKRESLDWTFVFRDYYEALRTLIEAFLLFDQIEAESHQCKNAYICFKYPQLELDWEFLELVRLKRNAINYRGEFLRFEDWNRLKINFDLHLNKIRTILKDRLKGY